MMKTNIDKTRERIILCLTKNEIHIINEDVSPSQVTLTIDPINNFHIEISEQTITILYGDEHDDFFLQPYKSETEFIDDALRHILRLLQNKVIFEYFYSKNTLLKYKIWVADKAKNKKEIYKRVTTSLNPFLRLKPKSITTKEIIFNSQK